MRADFALVTATGRPLVLVEAKERLDVSLDWAIRFRRNYLAHAAITPDTAFLLVTPSNVFYWAEDGDGALLKAPDVTVPWNSLRSAQTAPSAVQSQQHREDSSFQGSVWEWLTTVVSVAPSDAVADDVRPLLTANAMLAARGGTVIVEPFV